MGKGLESSGIRAAAHSMSGTIARRRAEPWSLSAYSTRGGASGNTVLVMIPSWRSSFKVSESVRGLIPGSAPSSALNRTDGAFPRVTKMQSVHFFPMRSMIPEVQQTHAGTRVDLGATVSAYS